MAFRRVTLAVAISILAALAARADIISVSGEFNKDIGANKSSPSTSQSYQVRVPAGQYAEVRVRGEVKSALCASFRACLSAKGEDICFGPEKLDKTLRFYSDGTFSMCVKAEPETRMVQENVVDPISGAVHVYFHEEPYDGFYCRIYYSLVVKYVELAPDLKVTSLVIDPQDEALDTSPLQVKLSVANVGGKVAAASVCRVYDGAEQVAEYAIGALAVGQSENRTLDLAARKTGRHEFRVVCDATDVVKDEDESDNVREAAVDIRSASGNSVRYHANGGTGTMADGLLYPGQYGVLRNCAFRRLGKIFLGWATQADGDVEYAEGAEVVDLPLDERGVSDLYAVWDNGFTITYHSGTSDTRTFVQQIGNSSPLLRTCPYENAGLAFVGWARYEGAPPVYVAGARVTTTALRHVADGATADNIDLYAAWGVLIDSAGRFYAKDGSKVLLYRGGDAGAEWTYRWSWRLSGGGYMQGFITRLNGMAQNVWLCAVIEGIGKLQYSGKNRYPKDAIMGFGAYDGSRLVFHDLTWGSSAASFADECRLHGGTSLCYWSWHDLKKRDGGLLSHAVFYPLVKPAAVAGVTATATDGKFVRLSWEAVSQADSYAVYRSETEDGVRLRLGKCASAHFTDFSAAVGKRYYYHVAAVNESGESETSEPVHGGIGIAAGYTIRFLPGEGSGSVEEMSCFPGDVRRLRGEPASFSCGSKRFAGWRCSNGRRYDDGMLVFNLAQSGETVTMTAIWE